jgi:hypothetical protein
MDLSRDPTRCRRSQDSRNPARCRSRRRWRRPNVEVDQAGVFEPGGCIPGDEQEMAVRDKDAMLDPLVPSSRHDRRVRGRLLEHRAPEGVISSG